MEEVFEKIKKIAEADSTVEHKIDHVMRVFNTCLLMADGEDVDLDVLKASALLHDIARAEEDRDQTGKVDHAVLGAEMAGPILKDLGFDEEKIARVQKCILSHRYRNDNEPDSLEAKILFDADKLDTIGAVGVARSYMWIGKNNAMMYSDEDTDTYIKENLGGKPNGKIQDRTRHSPQIEFKTKTKFLKDKLYTEKGKRMCEERLAYYESFLDRLEKEIKGQI